MLSKKQIINELIVDIKLKTEILQLEQFLKKSNVIKIFKYQLRVCGKVVIAKSDNTKECLILIHLSDSCRN